MSFLLPAQAGLGNVTFINEFLSSASDLGSTPPGLSQNGGSPLGTFEAPMLSPFFGGSQNVPWGNNTAGNTDYYNFTPETGVTRYYNFEVARGTLAPEGIPKPMLLANGQFPGPMIEANWGDWIEVTVKNSITGPEEGTALHWHGMLQKATPWYDGVPGVTMCPIAPGETFKYRFQADMYGSSWWHAHYSAQYAGGLLGPMIIHGPTDNYPTNDYLDLGPVIVSDSYFLEYYTLVEQSMSTIHGAADSVTSRNTLIQGKMTVDCSTAPAGSNCTSNAGLAKFKFKPGRAHLLRIINTSAAAYMVVSLDEHDMTVVANDMVAVKPYTVSQVQLFVGQRTDVLITANKKSDAYWLRARQSTLCSDSTQPFALAAVYYDGVSTTKRPRTLPNAEFIKAGLDQCSNDPLSQTEPYYPIALASPDVTLVIDIALEVNETGHTQYTMNGQNFRANYNHPLLNLTFNGNTSYPDNPQWNVYNFGSNETIRIVWQNNNAFGHPMHIHGQNLYVLDEGVGRYDGSNVVRPENPQRRDVQSLRPNGYLVTQLVSENPGVWPYHCHIAWHVGQGLMINVVQKPEMLSERGEIPGVIAESCGAWWDFTGDHAVDQIDSGLRFKEVRML